MRHHAHKTIDDIKIVDPEFERADQNTVERRGVLTRLRQSLEREVLRTTNALSELAGVSLYQQRSSKFERMIDARAPLVDSRPF